MPTSTNYESSMSACKNGWAKQISNNVQKDKRDQPWKATFHNEDVNSKVTKEADFAVYDTSIPQANGLAA